MTIQLKGCSASAIPPIILLAGLISSLSACDPSAAANPVPVGLPASVPILTPAPAMTVEKVGARISRVVDADTIALDIEEGLYRVRHIGMDTPGTSHPQVEVECFAPEAAGRNRELVQGQTLYLEKVLSETDQYGRLLRYVWLPDGRMVNEVLAAEGYALSIRREVCR